MAEKKSAAKPATTKPDPNILQVREGLEGITKGMSESDIAARMSTRQYMTAHAHRAYAGFGKDLVSVTSIDAELRANGDAVVAGDLGRIERALTSQFLTLDTIFANLAERSSRQEYIKQMETFMRLALKAQAQARSTAEALALLKNPMPYIRQANIANGPQQVNNAGTQNTGTQQSTQKSVQQNKHAHAEKTETEPNKLLEANHGQRLDIGAQAAAGRANPHMATVEAVHRA
jgi:hypothetical protein